MIIRLISLVSMFLVLGQNSACAQDAHDYLEEALKIIESRALKRDQMTWSDAKSRAKSMCTNSSKNSDTYPAIVYALSQLNDNHSFMLMPDGRPVPFPPGTRRNADSRSKRLTVRQETAGFLQSDKGRVGHIVIKSVAGDELKLKDYCTELRKQVSRCRNYGVKGWIIDLRGNSGGNMWPMLAGIGPVLGAGTLGYFVSGQYFTPWFYKQGTSGVVAAGVRRSNFSIVDGLGDYVEQAPIAVLLDRNTLSSGEAVAIAFKGRANTKFFGERSGGLSTANESIKMSDGATILLTVSVEADRNRKIYSDGIDCDVPVEQGNVPAGSPRDPVIAAALRWIGSASH